jgi:large subunit ribosomal protein L31e
MSEKNLEEKMVVIPLWKSQKTGRYRQTHKAMSVLRDEVAKVVKDNDFLIDTQLNEYIWARGIKNPPKRITVRIKKGEDGKTIVTLP